MTVSAQVPSNSYTANGVTTVFPYTFKIVDADDLLILVDGVETISGFTVSGVGVGSGGNVTFSVAPASASVIVVKRDMEITRETDYQEGGDLLAETLDADIDRTFLVMQQIDEEISRSITLPAGSASSGALPEIEANSYLVGNSAGNALEFVTAVPGDPDPDVMTDATLNGTERIALKQGGGWFRASFEGLGDWLLKTFPGFQQAGTGTVARTMQDKARDNLCVLDFGVVGDGIADDSAAVANIESAHVHRTVDMAGKTLLVTTTPSKNNYINGQFRSDGATLPQRADWILPAPRCHTFGGQLAKLRAALSDPLQQMVGICFIGDSITWGRTLPGNGAFDPRNGTLSDPRDNFASPSFVNEFKRYIGANYCFGANPVLSNWPASPSGESIAEYSRTFLMYPRERQFNHTVSGVSQGVAEATTLATPSGFQFALLDGDALGASYQEISFTFTGKEFTLIYACVDGDYQGYELFVSGVSQGVFTTASSGGGRPNTNNNRRVHTFPYVRDGVVSIRTKRPDSVSGVRKLRLEGIEVTKIVRISNQGIIGATTRSYNSYNLSGSFSDPTAVTAEDNFVFLQLGTNDRGRSVAVPAGVQGFQRNLSAILQRLSPLADLVVMAALPAQNESTVSYSFNMQDARSVLLREAANSEFDFIDNYALFNGLSSSVYTADGLHPNAYGMQRICKNIVAALEA